MTDTENTQTPILVIGAGVIGLSSAYHLMKDRGFERVLCVSDQFSPRTTSDGAGAIWEPYTVESAQEQLIHQWSRQTMDFELDLIRQGHSWETGIYQVTGRQYYRKPLDETPYWASSTPYFRELDKSELDTDGNKQNKQFRYGFEFTTVIAESPKFLRWLQKKILSLGGQFLSRRLTSFDEAIDAAIDEKFISPEEVSKVILINCCGYGAKFLCNDDNVIAVRGQVLRVFAPQIQQFRIDVENQVAAYVLPRLGCGEVVCGGTTDYGEEVCQPNESTSTAIWEKCKRLVPELDSRNSGILQVWVGLRPYRKHGVRIEREKTSRGYAIIHNYGHGGSGHTLYWGCALDVGKLASEIVSGSKLVPKL